MNAVTSWSFSAWDMWRECPLRYKLAKIDKLATSDKPAFKKGREIHEGIAKFLTRASNDLPPAVRAPGAIAVYKEFRTFDNIVVEQQWGFDRQWKPTGWFTKGPRATWLRTVVDAGVLYDDMTAEVIDHKGLALDTLLPTPEGFTTMGDVAVGDYLFGTTGRPTRVVAKSAVHHRRCFRISFKNGATPIVCDDDHLWRVRRRSAGSRHYEVLVKAAALEKGDFIECAAPLQGRPVRLPVDPYVLGCWLGDGHVRDGMISKPDADLFHNIEKRGYPVLPVQPSSRMGRTVKLLRGQLDAAGLLNNKHVPRVYFRAPVKDRLLLLHGLMDTDGSLNKVRGEANFVNTDKGLVESVAELVSSLGEKPYLTKLRHRGFGKEGVHWRVMFSPRMFNPFRLPRKRDLVKLRGLGRHGFYVTGVGEVPSVPTQCVEVNAFDSMYLVGAACIPTHNSGKPRGSYDDQLELFALATMLHLPAITHVTTRLQFVEHDVPPVIHEYPSADRQALVAKWEGKVRPMFEDEAFLPRPGEACRFCDFNRSGGGPCRYG